MNTEEYLDGLLALPGMFRPMVSRDLKWVAWTWFRMGPAADVFAAPTDGSKFPIRLTETIENTYIVSWVPDSSAVIIAQDKGGNERYQLFQVDIDEPTVMHPLTEADPNFFIRGGELHPNKHFLIFGANYDFESEEELLEAQHEAAIDRMKSMLGGTFGALGDDLMWLSLKPFLGTLAVLLFLLGHEWAFIWMAGVFSILNIALRFKGVELGLKGVLAIQQFLQKIKPNRVASELKRATCVLLGAVVGVLLSAPQEHFAQGAGFWFGAAIIVPVIVACFLLRSKNVSSGKIGVGICVLVLIGVLLS